MLRSGGPRAAYESARHETNATSQLPAAARERSDRAKVLSVDEESNTTTRPEQKKVLDSKSANRSRANAGKLAIKSASTRRAARPAASNRDDGRVPSSALTMASPIIDDMDGRKITY